MSVVAHPAKEEMQTDLETRRAVESRVTGTVADLNQLKQSNLLYQLKPKSTNLSQLNTINLLDDQSKIILRKAILIILADLTIYVHN